jgi:CPA1 family monovalent cation:H+ antiporter
MLLVVATGVVVITLVVQGTTLAPLVRRLGVTTSPADEDAELTRAGFALAVAGLNHLDGVADALQVPSSMVEQLRTQLQHEAELTRRLDDRASTGRGHAALLRSAILDVQAEELAKLRAAGEISAETFRKVQRRLDTEHLQLND